MNVFQRKLLLFGFCLAIPFFSHAQSAESYFQLGMEAFQNAAYQQALQHFLTARELGLENKRLPYNLGVTYYKLGQYQQAYDILDEAAEDKALAFLVYINRALCAQKLQQSLKVTENLKLASANAASEQERLLAANMLQKTGSKSGAKRYDVSAMLGLGYNDNVISAATDDVDRQTQGSDSYARYFAKVKFNPWQRIAVATQVDGVKYLDLSEYDYNNLDFRLFYEEAFKNVEFNLGGEFEKVYLDGDSIWETSTAFFLVRYKIHPGATVHGAYKNSAIRHASEQYEYLQGDRRQAEFGARLNIQNSLLKMNYHYETNDRENISQPGRETNYSPTRHKLSLKHQFPVSVNTAFEWGGDYRQSEYGAANRVSGALVVREDRRSTAGLLVSYRLSNSMWLVASYQWLRNDSNIDAYTYKTNNYFLSMVWQ